MKILVNMIAFLLSATIAFADTTQIVSISEEGIQSNNQSRGLVSISSDGRYVVFESEASNLVEDDTNGVRDVFVFDSILKNIKRVSVTNEGHETNGQSNSPSISADGKWIVFVSFASNIDPFDYNGRSDIFIYDMSTGKTELVSKTKEGLQAYNNYFIPSLSYNGRYVVFYVDSFASNLVNDDTNQQGDIYVIDRETGTIERVSVANDGDQGNGSCYPLASISADGRFVAFSSDSDNLVEQDTNGMRDVFVRDRVLGTTERISISSTGIEGDSYSTFPVISGDGKFVAFYSYAINLLPANLTQRYRNIFVHDRSTKEIEIVSVSSDGTIADYDSDAYFGINYDGRFVSFCSSARNLVPNDNGYMDDIFVHDRLTGKTEMVNTGYDLEQGNAPSGSSVGISSDGRYVVFTSLASNLVPNDFNAQWDVFLKDLANDNDGDGAIVFSDILIEDCVDTNPNISPSATEIPYNGIDENCNGTDDDDDLDGDGYLLANDCNDNDPTINPGVIETPYNGIDENCNGMADDDDLDQDGFVIATDCSDNDSSINPGAIEIPYNGIDNNCNGMIDDDDLDRDGFVIATDCNDYDPARNPGATEIPYNGIDDNCSGMADDDDLDQDGFGVVTDCKDNDPTINPSATEIYYNGIDENCNGMTDDDDVDRDGFNLNTDCNDNDATIHPNAYEIFNNGIDENCNGPVDDAQAAVIVESLADEVQAIPLEVLMPPLDAGGSTTSATEVATNRSSALQNMVSGVSTKLATINDTMTAAEKLVVFNECLVDLGDILVKTDGFYGGSLANDWVTTQAGQGILYPHITGTINFVQGEIDKLLAP